MQSALTSVIDQLILECNDERARLKEKKRKLEGIRSSLAAGQPVALTEVMSRHDSVTSSDEPPAKKSKKSKSTSSSDVAAALVADDSKKKKKEKKDPNKPKKAPSAYNLFFLEYSKKYKTDHPEIKQTEIMGVVGPVWKEMDGAMKAPYEARANVLKEKAGEAMAAYTSGVPAAAASSSSSSAPAPAPAQAASPVKVVQVKVKATPIPAPTPVRKDSVSSSSSSSSDGDSSSSSSDSSPEPTPTKKAKKSK